MAESSPQECGDLVGCQLVVQPSSYGGPVLDWPTGPHNHTGKQQRRIQQNAYHACGRSGDKESSKQRESPIRSCELVRNHLRISVSGSPAPKTAAVTAGNRRILRDDHFEHYPQDICENSERSAEKDL